MAKLTRKLQKLFGSGAGGTGITEFGSPATGTPVYTTDLDAIQTTAYENGWADAALAGGEIPAFQDFNALNYANSYQLKYIQQEGICEFLSTQEYHANSVVKKSGTYELYGSIINDNIGNALPSQADDANWTYLGDLAELANTTPVVVDNIKLQPSVSTTSGSAFDFVGIPSGVNRITLALKSISTTGADFLDIQIGDAGGFETTGYEAGCSFSVNAGRMATDGFPLNVSPVSGATANANSGVFTLTRVGGNVWSSLSCISLLNVGISGAGSKELSGELTQLRFKTLTGSFDAGEVSISWEF